MDKHLKAAIADVRAFVASNPAFRLADDYLMPQGSTNRVVRGMCADQPVIFKHFWDPPRRERELFGLRHWAPSGLVPVLYECDHPCLIVMSQVPGSWLAEFLTRADAEERAEATRNVARAMATLISVPLSVGDRRRFEEGRLYDFPTLEAYIGRILELARGVHQRQEAYRTETWGRSLTFMEAQLEAILAEPRVLYHQDVANFYMLGERFSGFFDLEMCRVGCVSMQLGSGLMMFDRYGLDWDVFCEAFENKLGRELGEAGRRSALAAHHFLKWREVTRYLSWSGDASRKRNTDQIRKEAESLSELLVRVPLAMP